MLTLWTSALLLAVPFGLGAAPAAAATIDDVVDTEQVNATEPVNVTLLIETGFHQDSAPDEEGERGADGFVAVDCTADAFNETGPVAASGCDEDRGFHSNGVGRPIWIRCGVECRSAILLPVPYADGSAKLETGAGDAACGIQVPPCTVDAPVDAPEA